MKTSKLPTSLNQSSVGQVVRAFVLGLTDLTPFQSFPGTCDFEVKRKSSLIANNDVQRFGLDLQVCRDLCINSTEFFCLSFEYNSLRRLCHLSSTHRYTRYTLCWVELGWLLLFSIYCFFPFSSFDSY